MNTSIRGYEYMRKVVIIDGAHLKGKYGGCLLTASCQDGNYQVFPLAVAIVDGENDASWEWFFRKLSAFVAENRELVFMSDRHASIKVGLNKVYSKAEHCACILHIQRNIKAMFKTKNLSYVVSKAARAYRVSDFYTAFQDIKRMDARCADYLLTIGLKTWARSQSNSKRYNIMTSNVAECWNAVLKEARDFPVISLLEFIRAKLMTWFAKRRAAAEAHDATLTPRTESIISANFELSSGFDVRMINTSEFEVRTKEGVVFCVNLLTKTCNCLEFQTLFVPCTHAVAAVLFAQESVEYLAIKEYSTLYWRMAYKESIYHVEDITETPGVVDALSELELHPPSTRRPPGRPRKRRIASTGEFKVTGMKRVTVCGRCGTRGHNRKTCKSPI